MPWVDKVYRTHKMYTLYIMQYTASLLTADYNLKTRMWANAQPDGRPAEHRWRPLFNAAKFG